MDKRIMDMMSKTLSSRLFVAIFALVMATVFGTEAGAATMLVGLNTGEGEGEGEGGGEGGEGTALTGGEGDEAGEGGGSGEEAWTNGMSDELKAFFGESKSLEEFQAGLPKAPEVPDEYTAPEGVEVDQEVFTAFTPVAKELGLSNEQMAGLLKFDAQRMADVPSMVLAQAEVQMKEGLTAMETEMGAEKFGATIESAKRVITSFGDEEVSGWLNETRMGNHPVLVKFLAKIGNGLSEDQFSSGQGGGTAEKSAADILYPNQGKK